uniref:Protein-S-isoprenylcysteine O-methyltransferase n=1 Tax=Athene cunicularia TaxID=194338 RepID=A0A663LZZ6_ATHCN
MVHILSHSGLLLLRAGVQGLSYAYLTALVFLHISREGKRVSLPRALLTPVPSVPSPRRYMCSLSLFHYSEYLVTAINNPRSLSLDSFLLNHSFEYNLAALSSWVEFTLEKLLFPELKQITWLSTVGLLMVVFGDCLRKAAMLTAGSNFNHIVQNEKSDTHTLVTSGVYGWFRHPSYVGWFYWSIGTQVLLCNPICMVGYALVSWRFFRERVEEEEITLIHFFGEEYLEYKRKVPSGLPFIKGVKVEL